MSLKVPDPNQPSQKQLDFLKSLGYLGSYEGLKANEAAELIDELLAEQKQADKPADYYDNKN
jgi:hypothetical protein